MSDKQSAFTQEPDLSVENYRPLSIAAIVSLVLGLIGVIGMFNPYLLVIPFVGVLVGAITLVRLQRNPHRYSGQLVAAIGLALSLLFASWGGGYASMRSAHIYDQAEEHVEFWFALLSEGKRPEAFELCLKYESRKRKGTDLDELYSLDEEEPDMEEFAAAQGKELGGEMMTTQVPNVARMEFKMFFEREPAKTIADYANKGKVTLLRNEALEEGDYVDRVSQIYRMDFVDETGRERFIDFRVLMERWAYPGTDVFQWNVARVEKVEATY